MKGIPKKVYAKDGKVMVLMKTSIGQINTPLRDEHYKMIFKRKPKSDLEAEQFALKLRKMRKPLDFPNMTGPAGGRKSRSRREELERRKRRRSGIVKVEFNDVEMEEEKKFPTMEDCVDAAVANKSALVEYDHDSKEDTLSLKFNVSGKRTKLDTEGQKVAAPHIKEIKKVLGIKQSSKVTFSDQ